MNFYIVSTSVEYQRNLDFLTHHLRDSICGKIHKYISVFGGWNVLLSILALAAKGRPKHRLELPFAL